MAIVRVNFNNYEEGEQYRFRVLSEANTIFGILLTLLSSYWRSSIDGPQYARQIKAMAFEIARIRVNLDDVKLDTEFTTTRSEFIYQNLTSLLFPKSPPGAPNPGLSDLDFRDFLVEVLAVYFQGSIPDSMKKSVELLTKSNVVVKEAFSEARKPGSVFDISDQFTFFVDILMESPSDFDVFLADKNIQILLNIIRPAHTLYRLKYVLRDEYRGNLDEDDFKILDSFRWVLYNYGYEDFRKFCDGIEGIDYLGVKRPIEVLNEDHTADFQP